MFKNPKENTESINREEEYQYVENIEVSALEINVEDVVIVNNKNKQFFTVTKSDNMIIIGCKIVPTNN